MSLNPKIEIASQSTFMKIQSTVTHSTRVYFLTTQAVANIRCLAGHLKNWSSVG